MSKRGDARIRKWVKLMQDVRAGRKYTKANDTWAPMSQNGLVHMHSSGAPMYRVESVTLTEAGVAFLEFYEKEFNMQET